MPNDAENNTPAKKSSVFVWYHAQSDDNTAIQAWLDTLKSTHAIHGHLYIRKDDHRVTYMECYEGITAETSHKIEAFATQQPIFEHIERRCEAFEKIKD